MQNDKKFNQFRLNDLISTKIFDDLGEPFILPFILYEMSLGRPWYKASSFGAIENCNDSQY